MTKHTLIIAEAGVNHNGDIGLAHELIDVAVATGADFVKFQTFSADRVVTKSAAKAEYQIETTNAAESQHAMLSRLELSREMHEELIKHCQNKIGFLSTGFDTISVDLLVELGAERIKIPSGEINNMPYLRHVGRLNKSLLLSTGMASLGEIEAALEVLESAGAQRSQITVLHCSTDYPTPMRDVNLRAMCNIQKAFGVEVGYSDHTLGFEVAIAAVALGACVIEKHLTLDHTMPGPDHKASLEPDEFTKMVGAIRNIELALGDGIKRASKNEIRNKLIARRSIVASTNIRAGETFTPDNIGIKRPGTGISPMRWDEVIGRVATRDYYTDEPIEP